MNWISQLIVQPFDLNQQYPCCYQTRQSNGGRNLVSINDERGENARKLILEKLGDDKLSTTELMRLTNKTHSGALKRILKIMVSENLLTMTIVKHRAYWEKSLE